MFLVCSHCIHPWRFLLDLNSPNVFAIWILWWVLITCEAVECSEQCNMLACTFTCAWMRNLAWLCVKAAHMLETALDGARPMGTHQMCFRVWNPVGWHNWTRPSDILTGQILVTWPSVTFKNPSVFGSWESVRLNESAKKINESHSLSESFTEFRFIR